MARDQPRRADALRFMRRPAARIALLLGVLVATGSVSAHEIGTTRVTVAFTPSGEYDIEVSTDAAALVARLESAAGQPRSGTLAAEDLIRRVEELGPQWLGQVRVSFDDRAVTPRLEYPRHRDAPVTDDELFAPVVAKIHLRGPIPPGARTFRWQYELTASTYGLTVTSASRQPHPTEWLEAGQVSRVYSLGADSRESPAKVALGYLALGFTHILPHGVDHILFVLGLFLFSPRLAPLLWQVSAFTLAHTLTLGLTLYKVVPSFPEVVEPLIALSIVYVAIENLTTSELRVGRLALVFAFGLLHGMGFAGALAAADLPGDELLIGLVGFNLGVEAGQIAVLAAAFLLVASWSRDPLVYRRLVVVPASLLIAVTGVYWTIQRLSHW